MASECQRDTGDDGISIMITEIKCANRSWYVYSSTLQTCQSVVALCGPAVGGSVYTKLMMCYKCNANDC